MKSAILLLISLFTAIDAWSQTPQLTVYPLRERCPGALAEVGFNLNNGSLATGNVFSLTIVSSDGTVSRPLSVSAYSTGSVKAQLPDDISPGWYYLLLRSSNPSLVSLPSQLFELRPRPKATLRLGGSGPVDPYQPVLLKIDYQGPAPYTVELSDGNKLNNYYATSGEQDLYVRPGQSSTYSIRSVTTDNCGSGSGSGQAEVRVNPFGIQIIDVWPKTPCFGNSFTLTMSTDGTFGTTNAFSVQVVDNKDDVVATLPAQQVAANQVQAMLPAAFSSPETGFGYRFRIVSTNPIVVGAANSSLNGSNAEFRFGALPQVQLGTLNTEISWGATVDLPLTVQGDPPISLTFVDGTTATLGTYQSSIRVKPEQTTIYKLKAVASVCGTGIAGGQAAVQVKPGIIVTTLATNTACMGQLVQLPVQTNGQFNADNQFWVNLTASTTGKKTRLPATLQANTLRFTAPGDEESYACVIESTSPAGVSTGYPVQVSGTPKLTYWSLDNQQPQRLTLSMSGLVPATVTLTNGQQLTFDTYTTLYVPLVAQPTTVFKAEIIRNACGAGTVNVPPISYTNPNSILLSWATTNPVAACAGSAVSLSFVATGALSATTTYQVEIGTVDYNTGRFTQKAILGTGTGSPLSVTIPASMQADSYQLRLVCNNPLSLSDPISFAVQKPLTLSYRPYDERYKYVAQRNERTSVTSVEFTGPPPVDITLSDGSVWAITSERPYPLVDYSKVGTFYVKSVSNTCGAGTVARTDTFYVMPFKASVKLDPRAQLCAGSLVRLPLVIEGNRPANTHLTLQLGYGTGPFKTLPVVNQDTYSITFQLPDTLRHLSTWQSKDYYRLRVVAPELNVPAGDPVLFYGRKVPAALLSGPATSTGVVMYDPIIGAVELAANIRGSSPMSLFVDGIPYSGNRYADSYESGYITTDYDQGETVRRITVAPTQRTTYTLKAVRNSCGYGSVTGQVTVGVAPKISLQTDGGFITVCENATLAVDGKATGEFEATNQFRVLLSQNQEQRVSVGDQELTKVASLDKPVTVTIPPVPSGVIYYLKLAATQSGNIVSYAQSIRVIKRPSAILSGSSSINAGDITYLVLANQGGGPYQYELSDGTKGVLYDYASQLIDVRPAVTTTYLLRSLSNDCGSGQVSGSAEVTVNPPSSFTIRLANPSPQAQVCAGARLIVPFSVSGVTGNAQTYGVQLSDGTGRNFIDIPTVGTGLSLTATIPSTTPAGPGYRFRVATTGQATVSSASQTSFSIAEAPDAVLSAQPYIVPGQPVTLLVELKGTPPFNVVIGDSVSRVYQYVNQSRLSLTVYPVRPTTYRVFTVSNQCGTVMPQSTVTVDILTATEQPLIDNTWQVVPNPASSYVQVKAAKPVHVQQVRILNLAGQTVHQLQMSGQNAIRQIDLDAHPLPAGIYIIRLETDRGAVSIKLLKQ